jgi:hypothetical protein
MKLCISTRKMAPRGYLLRAQQANSYAQVAGAAAERPSGESEK